MRVEAILAAWKNGVSQVYLKFPLFFSKEALYSLCYKETKLLLGTQKDINILLDIINSIWYFLSYEINKQHFYNILSDH